MNEERFAAAAIIWCRKKWVKYANFRRLCDYESMRRKNNKCSVSCLHLYCSPIIIKIFEVYHFNIIFTAVGHLLLLEENRIFKNTHFTFRANLFLLLILWTVQFVVYTCLALMKMTVSARLRRQFLENRASPQPIECARNFQAILTSSCFTKNKGW